MLNEVLDISPLPSKIAEKLVPVDDFYICTQFTPDMIGARIVTINGIVYHRFMNYIFSPQPPESLDTEKIRKICDLRLEYFDKLVDRELNRYAVESVVRCCQANLMQTSGKVKALDFGCGEGLSTELLLEHLPGLDITGIDISEKAIASFKIDGIQATLTRPGEPLPFPSASFDLIFAIFVMHFNVDLPTLCELRRILRPSGLFVFNVYQRDTDGLREQLEAAGFCSIEDWECLTKIGINHVVMSSRVAP